MAVCVHPSIGYSCISLASVHYINSLSFLSLVHLLLCDCKACVACLHRFGSARSPSEVSESLRQIILRLYDKHLASDGKALNYKALKQDPVFKTYVNATAELQNADVASLNR